MENIADPVRTDDIWRARRKNSKILKDPNSRARRFMDISGLQTDSAIPKDLHLLGFQTKDLSMKKYLRLQEVTN